jgi:ferredoxin
MANPADRNAHNVPGAYYIDSSCIDCDQCRVLAPETFERDGDSGIGYVKRQPATPEEIDLAEEARTTCATGSIGHDGA